MTKGQVVTEITKRLGDPSAVAFGDRIYGYFLEVLYELIESLSPMEQINLTVESVFHGFTGIDGVCRPTFTDTPQSAWTKVNSVNVNDIPATPITDKEYKMMLSNSMYAPSFDEAFYYFDGKRMVVLTGLISSAVIVLVNSTYDPHLVLADLADATTVPLSSSLIYRAIPLTVNKVKAEAGLTL